MVTKEIEKEFPNSYKNVDIYDKIVTYARSRGNDLLLEIYAKKIIDQQRSSNIFVKTPSIELEYIEALQRLNKLQDALDVVVGLKEYYSESTPQINYYGGELNFKLGNTQEAKTYFEECAKVSGAWQSICEQSLNLIK